jgi:hypothetical protein
MPRAKTRPGTVHVVITGTPAAVAKIDASLVVPQVDPMKGEIDLSQPGSANFPVIVDIPDVQVDVTPTKVLVKW